MRTPARLVTLGVVALAFAVRPSRLARAEDPAPAPPSSRDEPSRSPDEIVLATERVVAFKDGHALFVRRGRATADGAGVVRTSDVPAAAILGCLWASSPTGKVLGLRAGWRESTADRARTEPCGDIADVLSANVGRDVVLGLAREGAADVSGRILEVLGTTSRVPDLGDDPPRGPAGETVRSLDPVGPYTLVLDVSGLRRVFAVADVRTVSGAGLATTIARREQVTTRAKRLEIALGADAAGKPVDVRLFHFGQGVRWIPTYRVGGDLITEAAIELQGEVIDDAADLIDTELDLVVGVPTFRFADVPSPLSLESVLRSTLSRAAPQLMVQRVSNNFMSNSASDGDEAGPAPTPPAIAGDAAQDLFVHHVGKVTLKKGERASYPLLSTRSPLRHVYTVDVRLGRNLRSGASTLRREAVEEDARDLGVTMVPVQHQIELRNGGTGPWTTGAALVLQDEMPIAQNLLRYTSAGATTLLPLTTAVDLPTKYEESEVSRVPNALVWQNSSYALVTKRATITVRSRRPSASHVQASLRLGGKAVSATREGKITLDDGHPEDFENGYVPANNRSDVRWEADLPAGETITFDVVFSFYVA